MKADFLAIAVLCGTLAFWHPFVALCVWLVVVKLWLYRSNKEIDKAREVYEAMETYDYEKKE